MADKPAQICQLKKGILVDMQQGFVDTFNWAVQAIANLKGGENCEVNWDMPDHPTIDVTTHEDEVGGGGGGGGELSDVCVTDINVSRYNDYLSVDYTDGDYKTIPIPNIISSMSRETDWTGDDVLSIKHTQRYDQTIPLGITLSGTNNSYSEEKTQFKFKSHSDSRISVWVSGHDITLGVYYV